VRWVEMCLELVETVQFMVEGHFSQISGRLAEGGGEGLQYWLKPELRKWLGSIVNGINVECPSVNHD